MRMPAPLQLKHLARMIGQLEKVDDRGLELAESILHERRQFALKGPMVGYLKDVDQALAALSAVREITKEK